MVTDLEEIKRRVYELTQELSGEANAKRRAQLMLERSVFANMLMQKVDEE